MTSSRNVFMLILAAVLCPRGSAQVFEGPLAKVENSPVPKISIGALGAQLAAGLPGLADAPHATLSPLISEPLLAAPQVIPHNPVAAVPAVSASVGPRTTDPSMKVSAVAGAIAPGLKALQAPNIKGEDAASAAELYKSADRALYRRKRAFRVA